MGWLEVLAMLKRLLPLLTRVAPMLESYVGTRAAAPDLQPALDRFSAGLKHDLVVTAAAQRTETQAALAEQATALRDLRADLKHAREDQAAQAATVQAAVAGVQVWLRMLTVAVGLVLISLITITVLLLRR